MADIINLQELADAKLDAKSLEQFINGGVDEDVLTRLSQQYPTIKKLLLEFQRYNGRAYPTLAAANADIANIALNTKVWVLSETDGGDYYKATASATSLTKSPYDPVEQSKNYTDEAKLEIFDYFPKSLRNFTNLDLLTAALINSSTGEVVANENWRSSELIAVKEHDKITVNAQSNSTVNANIAFYNENEGFVSSSTCSTDITYQTKTFVAEHDGYVRFATRLPASPFSASISGVNKTLGEAEVESLIKLSTNVAESYLESEYETGYVYTLGGTIVMTSDMSHRAYLIPVTKGSVIHYKGSIGSNVIGQEVLYMAQLDENKNYVSDIATYTSTGVYVVGELSGTAVQDGFMYVRARVVSGSFYLNELYLTESLVELKQWIDALGMNSEHIRTDVDLLNTSLDSRVSNIVDASIDFKVSDAVAGKFEEISENTVEILVNNAITKSDLTSLTLVDPLIEKLPVRLSMDWGYNSQTYTQNNLVEVDDYQYFVGVDENRNPIIMKRSLLGGAWEKFDLSTLDGNPFFAPNLTDSHNNFVLTVTRDGYILITGNHHNTICRAVRSTNPHDISSFEVLKYSNEQVTYPRFITTKTTKKTLVFWRKGSSGNGTYWMAEFNDDTLLYENHRQIIGQATAHELSSGGTNPYEQMIAIDANDAIHLCWGYRTTETSAVANFGMFYAKSVDYGVTWKSANGLTSFATPMTDTISERIYTVDINEGYVNQNGGCVDKNNNYHTAFWHSDPATGFSRIIHAWFDGTGWRNEAVYNLGRVYPPASNLLPGYFSRPHVICGQSGKVFIIYKDTYVNANQIRAIDVSNAGLPKNFGLLNFGTRQTELAINIDFPIEQNELKMVLAKGGGNVTNAIWQNQSAYLVTIPLPVQYSI